MRAYLIGLIFAGMVLGVGASADQLDGKDEPTKGATGLIFAYDPATGTTKTFVAKDADAIKAADFDKLSKEERAEIANKSIKSSEGNVVAVDSVKLSGDQLSEGGSTPATFYARRYCAYYRPYHYYRSNWNYCPNYYSYGGYRYVPRYRNYYCPSTRYYYSWYYRY